MQLFHVPFKGGAPAVQSVVAGDTQVTFAHAAVGARAGQGRAAARPRRQRAQRSPLVPDLPGMVEAGLPDYSIDFWYGLFVPAGTPPDVARKVFDAAERGDARRPR